MANNKFFNALKTDFKHYCRWWWQTTRGENHLTPSRYDGLASFIISVIILALSFKSLYDTLLNFLANMFISAPSGTTLDQFGTHTVDYLGSFRHEGFLSGVIIITISFIILIGLSWLVDQKISHRTINIWRYLNQLATSTNGALLLEVIGMCLAFIGHGFKLVVLLDLVAAVIYQLGTVNELRQAHFNNNQLRLYVSAAMVCLYPVLFLVVLYLLILASH